MVRPQHAPAQLPDEAVSVLVLEIEGDPDIAKLCPRQDSDGVVALLAADADLHDETPILEYHIPAGNIRYWQNPADSVSWTFDLLKPGQFDVELKSSCENAAAGSQFIISIGDQKLPGQTKPTGGWSRFTAQKIGRLTLDHPGQYTLTLQPKSQPKWKSMGLESITLRPAK